MESIAYQDDLHMIAQFEKLEGSQFVAVAHMENTIRNAAG